MPPRRSCSSTSTASGAPSGRFQCHHGVPAPGPLLSGGADESGFNATTAFLLLQLVNVRADPSMRFQCHHGVPASPSPIRSALRYRGFQCHHGVPASRFVCEARPCPGGFQCHHGVPASRPRPDVIVVITEFQCHHGVPASVLGVQGWLNAPGFQCHHGVPASDLAVDPGVLRDAVSMPPRRSCFLLLGLWLRTEVAGFNATTAFLLRQEGG